jgi:hypothetical protein
MMVGESSICLGSGSALGSGSVLGSGSTLGSGCGSLLLKFGIRTCALRFCFSGGSLAAAAEAAAKILACASFSGPGAKEGREGDNIAGDVFER